MYDRLLGARAVRAGLIAAFVCAGLTTTANAEDRRPLPRQGHAAFELNRGRMVILGGESDFGALADEWIRRNGEWRYRETEFPARYDQTATVMDRERCDGGGDSRDRDRPSRVIMIGGMNDTGEAFDDIWRRNPRSGHWQIIGRNELARRSGHTAVSGPRGRSILVFGGQRDGQKLSDTFRMTFNRYGFPELARVATNGIPARDQHTMTYVPTINRIVVQGGRGDGDVALSDTYFWEPRDRRWVRIADAGFPARFNHTIYWDEKARRLVAIGGTDGTQQFSDAWAARPRRDQRHVLIEWVKIEKDAVGAREGQTAVYNERRRRAIVFGGRGPAGLLGDTHKVRVERTAFGTPTVQTYLVDDFTQDGDPITSSATTDCAADFDGSGTIDVADIMEIYASWGRCEDCPEDLDGNGMVGAGDVIEALRQTGACE